MKVIDGLEIRDTSSHDSLVYETPIPTKAKLIVYKNTYNQIVDIQLQNSVGKDFTDPIDISSIISAPAEMAKSTYK